MARSAHQTILKPNPNPNPNPNPYPYSNPNNRCGVQTQHNASHHHATQRAVAALTVLACHLHMH